MNIREDRSGMQEKGIKGGNFSFQKILNYYTYGFIDVVFCSYFGVIQIFMMMAFYCILCFIILGILKLLRIF